MNIAEFLMVAAASIAMVFGIIWAAHHFHWIPPCDGGKTGLVTYDGRTVECWHGSVIKVYPRGRREGGLPDSSR